jgi:uncharacterized membrane protein YtjA (UPF0391 family)
LSPAAGWCGDDGVQRNSVHRCLFVFPLLPCLVGVGWCVPDGRARLAARGAGVAPGIAGVARMLLCCFVFLLLLSLVHAGQICSTAFNIPIISIDVWVDIESAKCD